MAATRGAGLRDADAIPRLNSRVPTQSATHLVVFVCILLSLLWKLGVGTLIFGEFLDQVVQHLQDICLRCRLVSDFWRVGQSRVVRHHPGVCGRLVLIGILVLLKVVVHVHVHVILVPGSPGPFSSSALLLRVCVSARTGSTIETDSSSLHVLVPQVRVSVGLHRRVTQAHAQHHRVQQEIPSRAVFFHQTLSVQRPIGVYV
mmetsp:Transcript_31058/g.67840  ORF Transcript_31058/g.67840 Transcript_31058/m.67840 type:complete len:202 (-) Transcript_31058:90-695(-)